MNTSKTGKIPESYEFPLYLFYQGKNSEAYKFFGVHSVENKNSKCHCFRVWAPNAKSVSVVGDFNQWDKNANPMEKIADGIWETFISGLEKRLQNFYSNLQTADCLIVKCEHYL